MWKESGKGGLRLRLARHAVAASPSCISDQGLSPCPNSHRTISQIASARLQSLATLAQTHSRVAYKFQTWHRRSALLPLVDMLSTAAHRALAPCRLQPCAQARRTGFRRAAPSRAARRPAICFVVEAQHVSEAADTVEVQFRLTRRQVAPGAPTGGAAHNSGVGHHRLGALAMAGQHYFASTFFC